MTLTIPALYGTLYVYKGGIIMKLTEYSEIITQLSNPDLAAEGLVNLKAKLEADEKDYATLSTSVATLRDTNAKLALRITSPAPEPDKQEPEPDPYEVLEKAILGMYTKKDKED